MKKPINFAVSLLICGLLLLSGCTSAPSTSLPDELRASNAYYPKSVNIIAPDFFEPTGAENAEEAKQQWLDEMSERYGVDIRVFPNHHIVASINSSSAPNQVQLNQTNVGLFSINSYSTLKTGAQLGDFIPLDDYLADNPVWNALPEEFKSLYEIYGHIYAIPASISKKQMSRVIHNEAMESTGISVTDLTSFRDFSLAYHKKTTYPAGSCEMSDITDILNAFGLYPGNDSSIQFNWDPKEDCYADWLTKPAAAEAMDYLRKLYSAKALYLTSNVSTAFDYGVLASKYVPYYDYNNCTELLSLNPEYPQVIYTEMSGFAMDKGTPQPKETCNLLIDMLFGSEQSYLDCWLGSSDNYILNSDGTLTIKMSKDSEGNAVPPCISNLTGGLSQLFPYSDENIYYCPADDVSTDPNIVTAKSEARIKMLNDSLQNGSLVEIPPEFQIIKSAAYDKKIHDAADLYFRCCYDVIYGNPEITVQQIVDDYKAAMLALGGNQMLDEMNAAIGKKTAYYYG